MRMSHIAICVSDWEKSLRFYHDQLGFRFVDEFELTGAFTEALYGLKETVMRGAYLEREGVRIELREFSGPGQSSPNTATADCNARTHAFDRLGLSHVSLRVDDLDSAIHAVERAGGRGLPHTRVESPRFQMRAAFVVDPDGLRIELLQAPGDPDALPGA